MALKQTFLAIDPGSHQTGLALFTGDELIHWKIIKAPRTAPSYERIAHIMGEIQKYTDAPPGKHAITAVVCEKTTAIEGRHPAPELATLIRAIKSWATGRQNPKTPRKIWAQYHPSTVLASVRPKGSARGANSKDLIHAGIRMIYNDTIQRATQKDPDMAIPDGQQDIYDAIAVGHCHSIKTRTLNEI